MTLHDITSTSTLTLHYNYITLHYTRLDYTTLHYIMYIKITLQYTTLDYTTLH